MSVILIVDDQEELRWTHSEALSKAGFTIIEASNGIEAQKAISTQPVSLILSDVQMPEMCGCQLLKWVKENHPEIPLVFCSGGPLPEFVEGHRAYLQKPVQGCELVAVIEAVLNLSASSENQN